MKNVQCVERVVTQALKTGEGLGRKNTRTDTTAERVYRATHEELTLTKVFTLYHYDTPLLEVRTLKSNPYSQALSTILLDGAYSVSDRNAINTALAVLGLSHKWYARIRDYSIEFVEVPTDEKSS